MKAKRMAATALSYGNRQRAQTSSWTATPLRQTVSLTSAANLVPQSYPRRLLQQHQQQQQQHQQLLLRQRQQNYLLGRKQYSFIDSSCSNAAGVQPHRSALFNRGTSVDRCGTSKDTQQRPKRTSFQVQRHETLNQALAFTFDTKESRPRGASNGAYANLLTRPSSSSSNTGSGRSSRQQGVVRPLHKRDDVRLAWCSTSSLLRAFNDELSSDPAASQRKNNLTSIQSPKAKIQSAAQEKPLATPPSGDPNKINLNIVLSQTLKSSNDFEAIHSDDVDSSSECPEPSVYAAKEQSVKQSPQSNSATAAFRRAHFQKRRSTAFNVAAPTTTTVPSTIITAATTATVAVESLTVERKLVRAMSAPVRAYEDAKSIIKSRKPRLRRKPIARNISCDKTSSSTTTATERELLDSSSDDNNKKLLMRTRSTAADNNVITLVSLISSDLSDSEKEEDSLTGPTPLSTNSEGSQSARPLLRKTGKSVSFQENFMYPPNYQLAAKEYSHMIRRGSIAPLATRIRSNRPPTAPPVSIFLNDSTLSSTNAAMASSTGEKPAHSPRGADRACSNEPTKCASGNGAVKSEKENIEGTAGDYAFPQYVRSLKERECWKLYQKMANKGVNVSYETVLRGMLTPTEFRQVQKQREAEEAKLRALEELEKPPDESGGKQIPAIERLSESLLQK